VFAFEPTHTVARVCARLPSLRRRAAAAPEKTAAEVASELAKLELVRKRRADQAAQRIAAEGFDRFAAK
jgi:RIO-like serine/threonine protein kinase